MVRKFVTELRRPDPMIFRARNDTNPKGSILFAFGFADSWKSSLKNFQKFLIAFTVICCLLWQCRQAYVRMLYRRLILAAICFKLFKITPKIFQFIFYTKFPQQYQINPNSFSFAKINLIEKLPTSSAYKSNLIPFLVWKIITKCFNRLKERKVKGLSIKNSSQILSKLYYKEFFHLLFFYCMSASSGFLLRTLRSSIELQLTH